MGRENVDLSTHRIKDLGGQTNDFLTLQPGRITELVGLSGSGLTRLGLGLLAKPSLEGSVVVIDTRGWISPEAAWEAGVEAESLVVVRCNEIPLWTKVTAAILEGVPALYAEVPVGVKDQELRRLAALARARKTLVAFRPLGVGLPSGVSHLRLRALGVTWEGADQGHGKLTRRRLLLEASGKGAAGTTQRFEAEDGGRKIVMKAEDGGRNILTRAEDEGTNTLRVVSDVVVDPARRAAG